MEDLEIEIERLLELADWIEYNRKQCIGSIHIDEINRLADSRKEQIRLHIRNMIKEYTYELRLENQIYREVNNSNSKYVKLRSIIMLMIWICIWLLISLLK